MYTFLCVFISEIRKDPVKKNNKEISKATKLEKSTSRSINEYSLSSEGTKTTSATTSTPKGLEEKESVGIGALAMTMKWVARTRPAKQLLPPCEFSNMYLL